MSDSKVRVLVADDHAIFREGLMALFEGVPDVEVVGGASSGLEAVEQAGALSPDLVLMDIMMPDLDGIEATRRIRESNPGVKVIMLTMVEQDDSLLAALRAGARGYILKGADKAEVLRTLRAVAGGDVLFGPAVAARLESLFQSLGARAEARVREDAFPELTGREREVLELLARGAMNPEIAAQLHISPKTVSNHISNIFNKLQVVDRVQAMIKAREAGLGGN